MRKYIVRYTFTSLNEAEVIASSPEEAMQNLKNNIGIQHQRILAEPDITVLWTLYPEAHQYVSMDTVEIPLTQQEESNASN